MCESSVYLINEEGIKSLFFESVDKLTPQENGLLLEDILGEKKFINAHIKEMALVNHHIVIEANK